MGEIHKEREEGIKAHFRRHPAGLCLACAVLTAFLALLVIAFLAPDHRSSTLSTESREEVSGDLTVTTVSYVDPEGRIVKASDKGYASVRKTVRDGKTILEEYLDAAGERTALPAGYCAVRRIYNEEGLNTEIIYLDHQLSPVVISSGYDTIRRTYNERKLADTDTYWKQGGQTGRVQGYWSLKRNYGTGKDKKRVIRQEYLDENGHLTLNSSGYAYWTRRYNEQGKIAEVRYYDPEDRPAAVGSGWFGYTQAYDDQGRTVETVYLGADGKAANTDGGYAVIRTAYDAAGTKTMYYDRDGEPVTAGHSHYGILRTPEGGSTYLNEDGEVMRRLDNLLFSSQELVMMLGGITVILALAGRGKLRSVLIVLYGLGILYMTMAYRETGDSRARLTLFWSYRQFWTSRELRFEIINNILLFIPFGAALCGALLEKRGDRPGSVGRAVWITVLSSLIFSAGVECVQLMTGIGLFEFDDMISNSLGGLLGSMTALLGWAAFSRTTRRGKRSGSEEQV